MPYRSPLEDTPANLKRTILGTFDFRGRSTRTELLTFIFISQFAAGFVGLFVLGLVPQGDFDTRLGVGVGVRLLFGLPLVALLVRRLHDQDRTGWWAVLLVVAFVLTIVSNNWTLGHAGPAYLPPPWWLLAATLAVIIALWVFSLWPPSNETNRFGPNPRLDEEPAADQ
jgi:uncharacterized membrane protein YhaH (DUF805 family)